MWPVAHWDRRRSQHWACKRRFHFCFIVQIRDKAIFLYKNFSTNQNSRKNEIQFFHFFTIGIDGRVNIDAEKILLPFFGFSKSVKKNCFCYKNFATNQNSRKN